jgi:hypothetical protein
MFKPIFNTFNAYNFARFACLCIWTFWKLRIESFFEQKFYDKCHKIGVKDGHSAQREPSYCEGMGSTRLDAIDHFTHIYSTNSEVLQG